MHRISLLFIAVITCFLAGCASNPMVAQSTQLCQDWRVLSRSKEDKLTKRTADEMLASNKSREVWGCHPRENRAKSG